VLHALKVMPFAPFGKAVLWADVWVSAKCARFRNKCSETTGRPLRQRAERARALDRPVLQRVTAARAQNAPAGSPRARAILQVHSRNRRLATSGCAIFREISDLNNSRPICKSRLGGGSIAMLHFPQQIFLRGHLLRGH